MHNESHRLPADRLSERKTAHINICCDEELPIEGSSTFFEHVQFLHHSLPEIDYDSISTEADFLGYNLSAPFMISCMTGGSAKGYKLNKILATAAGKERIAIGTGSLRILLRKPAVIEHFRLKPLAPDVPVLGNIGAVQLPELFADNMTLLKQFFEILADLELDALVVHLNPGQEIFQQDGDRDLSGLLNYISRLCDRSPLPIIVKETGAGIAPGEAGELFRAGVRYVDIAGAGGTNWIAVEALREHSDEGLPGELEGFREWGIPTALALSAAISHCRERGVIPADGGFISSGGLRNGSDLAKSIALGAEMTASALPLIRLAKKQGVEACRAYIAELKLALKRIMLLSSSQNIAALQHAPMLFSSQFQFRKRELEKASLYARERNLHREKERPLAAAGSAFSDRRFRKYSIHKRRALMQADPRFKAGELNASGQQPGLLDLADAMIESAIGFMPVPLGIVRGCMIDGREFHLPLAVEEPSVLAAANYAARIISLNGGFETSAGESLMAAHIYLSLSCDPDKITELQARIQDGEARIKEILSETLASMTERGGGYRGIGSKWLPESQSLRVELSLDVRDAMGANILNTAAEKISPFLEELIGAEKLMAIVSNQAERRLARASFAIPLAALRRGKYEGNALGMRIVKLYHIANEDPARAVTHNKGIMNGITGLALATANDTRAIEAAAHAWAARSGSYRSLSHYRIDGEMLKGSLELPLALGTVGGAVSCHPVARLSLSIMRQPDAPTLARCAAALGLAQNFAALLALAGEGIQQGHMKLHANRLAYNAENRQP